VKRLQTAVLFTVVLLVVGVMLAQPAMAQLKLGYINSQQILQNFKDAQDVQKQLDAKNQEWQRQAQEMQKSIQDMQDQLESQSLLLSQEKKDEKTREIQETYAKFQKFQMEKWGQTGEAFHLQEELMKPVFDKINAVLSKIGKEEKFDYIFDGVQANIVYASPNQPDLTDRVLEELNKGVTTTTTTAGDKK